MQQTMYDLGVKNYKFFEAVDGKYVKVYNIVYNPVLLYNVVYRGNARSTQFVEIQNNLYTVVHPPVR